MVGKSDFNENSAISLDLDFGFRLRVCRNFGFGYIAVSCFFETFPAGWVVGWVVGKSDFNENPIVSPDLDMDFGLRLRVFQ